MNAIVKVLTGVLAVLAVVACLATVGILGYSMIRPQDDEETVRNMEEPRQDEAGESPAADAGAQQPVPTTVPEEQSENVSAPTPLVSATPANQQVDLANHVHDYEESIETKATCYRAGRLKYTCEDCGDVYYVDVMSTGHVAGDWEVSRKATAGADGLRVKKCIYCDEIVAQESVPYADASASASPGAGGEGGNAASGPHVHQYAANTEREPSCTLAGLRKYTCECGNFYTEMIPALGHVATDWEVAAAPTTTKMGTEQRTCSVCGVLLDSRPVNKLTSTPAASADASGNSQTSSSAAPNASGGNGQSQASNAPDSNASPSASGHSHEYQSYILKHPTCTQEGIRSFICGCGSSYAESIERDLNSHTYRATIIPATSATQGYTVYTCVRCNYSYVDNYTPALGNQ
ncbi:hypothetical protein D5282_13240 [bacterium 1xD8-48]|jgi:hypothetical protein|nr:hypothetical protein [Lachnospiraceae bacterium]NBJ98259.1 hypothetical protein [bacterium 1xD8-48]